MTKTEIIKQELEKPENEGLSSADIAAKIQHLSEFEDMKLSSLERSVRRVRGKEQSADSVFDKGMEVSGFETPHNWDHGWLKTKDWSIHIKNNLVSFTKDDLGDVIREVLKNMTPIQPKQVNAPDEYGCIFTLSDIHIGMDSAAEDSMYGFEYNEQVFNNHLEHLVGAMHKKIEEYKGFDTIMLDTLGDDLDGYNALTTRGGHTLDQNMNNREAWTAYVEGKLSLIKTMAESGGANNYHIRAVCNANHDGDYSWMANDAIRRVCEHLFPNVRYSIIVKPMQAFVYGKHGFILTHGKDKKNMKRPLPFHLTDSAITFINDYIEFIELKKEVDYIHVHKGDLHQVGYQRCQSFDYRNFQSFAPPSPYAQGNFAISSLGYAVDVVEKYGGDLSHTDHFFNLKTLSVDKTTIIR